MVEELASRWNFALPKYPPFAFDYGSELKKKGLMIVSTDNFNRLKYNPGGENIVHKVDNYTGLFRDKNGKCHDMRPHDDAGLADYLTAKLRGESADIVFKPTLANFRKLEAPALRRMLLLAYRTQLEELNNMRPYDILYENQLK